MNPRRSPKTASCLYILGFLSGLVFIVLCGSTAAYNQVNRPQPENQPAAPVANAPQNGGGQTAPQTIEVIDIDYGRTEAGDEFTVNALDIAPGAQVQVYIKDGERVLASKSTIADVNSAISVDFEPLRETLTLAQVEIVITAGEQQGRRTYPLFQGIVEGNTPVAALQSGQTTQATTGATPTHTPAPPSPTVRPPTAAAPTVTPPVLAQPSTATPIPTATPTPYPTPVLREVFYPNWRGEYYNNPSWANAPAVVRDDPHIMFNWGESSPVPGAVGQNWFSVRWTQQVVLPEGYYTFILSADDQAEVYMNGQKLLSYMGKTPSVNRISRYIQGFEPLNFEVKYIEYWGNAHIQFYWEYGNQDCCWTVNYYHGPEAAGEIIYSETIAGGDLRLDWRAAEQKIWEYVGYGNPFSARITRELQAPGQPGDYHLCVYANNNTRLWLDRNELVSQCNCGEHSCLICNRVYLGKNTPHQVSLDYMHTLGKPFLGVLTVPAREGEPWVGAFFDNPHLDGPPVVVRTAPAIDFDWAQFAPPDTGLHYDYFSARWQRTVPLVFGQYRFHVLVDDGARLRINGRTIIDQWEVGHARQFTALYDVWGSSEMAHIELDYYDETVMAVLKLWWDAPPSTPTPTPTMTPDP